MIRTRERHSLCAALLAATAAASACGHSRQTRQAARAGALPAQSDSSLIPVAVSPGALLAPGAMDLIQARLAELGHLAPAARSQRFDQATRAALARFQGTVALPSTGLPSYTTISRLGLSPRSIFLTAPLRESAPPEGRSAHARTGARE
jgi:hypothetical protein